MEAADFGDFQIISTLGKDPTGKAKVYKVERKTYKVGCCVGVNFLGSVRLEGH
jgi:hypothetical protein